MNPGLVIDQLQASDLAAALAIQSEVYPPSLVEDEAVFHSRLNLESSYCLAARQGARMLGYILAHGWWADNPPPLGTVTEAEAPNQVLFIHDLAVSAAGRGLRVGQNLVARAFSMASAAGIPVAQLIAVEGAAPYWRRLGFVETPTSDELGAKVASYGSDARWMTRDIPPHPGGSWR
jgi:predicted N-acetyltransferase YhbS